MHHLRFFKKRNPLGWTTSLRGLFFVLLHLALSAGDFLAMEFKFLNFFSMTNVILNDFMIPIAYKKHYNF